ncbi:MAG: hypothetical protein ACOCUO_00520 [archaeon]
MDRRKFLLGIGASAVGGSALIGTGAFSRVEAQRSVTIQVAEDPEAYLGLDKCDTPNGSYAHLDGDGHLAILMDPTNPHHTGDKTPDGLGAGINSNSDTWFDNVFQICNQGKEAACVWIEDHEDWPYVTGDEEERRVEFYLGADDEDSIIGEGNAFDLDVGDCVCVGIRTRSHGLSEDDELLDDLDNEITLVADVDGDCLEVPCVDRSTLYFVDYEHDANPATLYQVDLDDSSGRANLTELVDFADGDDVLERAHIGAAPDGQTVYAVSGTQDLLATYDVGAGTVSIDSIDEGAFDPALDDIVQVAVDEGGTIFAADGVNDHLFQIDPDVPEVVDSVELDLDVVGADLVFSADGTLYLYTNDTQSLYTIDSSDGSVSEVGTLGENLTGLAVRDGGTGDFLGSISQGTELVSFEENGDEVDRFELRLDGETFDHSYGDLTTGELCEPALR